MTGTWQNNRISEKLYNEYPRDFSICDIDGAVRCHYSDNGTQTRFILYESKNEGEKPMGKSQYLTLKFLRDSIDWHRFDRYSGLFVLKIIDLDNDIIWYNLEGDIIRRTNFDNLYRIFSHREED
jgi:hypothetical protein